MTEPMSEERLEQLENAHRNDWVDPWWETTLHEACREIRRLQEELNKFAGLARAQSFQLASLRKDNERLRADWAEVGKGAERQLLSALEVVRYIKQIQEENGRLRGALKDLCNAEPLTYDYDNAYEDARDLLRDLEGK